MSNQNGLNVRAILANTVILFGGIYTIRMIISMLYGFSVGLGTQSANAFGNSILLLGILALLAGLLAFWRGAVLPIKGTSSFITIVISLVAALVLLLLVNLLKLDSFATDTAIRHLGAVALGGLAGGYMGTMMVGKRTPA